jgi:hypothetical protein
LFNSFNKHSIEPALIRFIYARKAYIYFYFNMQIKKRTDKIMFDKKYVEQH